MAIATWCATTKHVPSTIHKDGILAAATRQNARVCAISPLVSQELMMSPARSILTNYMCYNFVKTSHALHIRV
jgi:hypothetical protein